MDGTQNPQPQRLTQPQVDNPLPETMELPQGDPNLLAPCQVTTVTPARAASPPTPYLQLGPQPSQTQQGLEVASQDMVIADNELGGWRTDTDAPNSASDSPMPTVSASPISMWGSGDVWVGVGENNTNYAYTDYISHGGNPQAIGLYASLNLGGGEDGPMNEVVMETTPSPTADSGVWRCSYEHMFRDGQGNGNGI